MNKLTFRGLKANEIDVRIGQIKDGKASFLLYKDARADMIILDETVGAMNWQRKHLRDNKNCIVEIWNEERAQWVGKEDTGTESNTEAEKGLASDSFKRACFNWGIGRELYTAPNIVIKCETVKSGERAFKLKNPFEFWGIYVGELEYQDGQISYLTVCVKMSILFKWGVKRGVGKPPEIKPEVEPKPKKETKTKKEDPTAQALIDSVDNTLISEMKLKSIRSLKIIPDQAQAVLKKYGYKTSAEIKEVDFMKIYNELLELEAPFEYNG